MFRFTIRDLLWLMVVVAMLALIWRERLVLKYERDTLLKEVAAQKASIAATGVTLNKSQDVVRRILQVIERHGSKLDPMVRADIQNLLNGPKPTLSDSELDRIKKEFAALGAPQPVPLPPGFGQQSN